LNTLKVDSKGNPAFIGADSKIHWKQGGKQWQVVEKKKVQDFAFSQDGETVYI
jgi:hypothetical protein